MGSLSTAIQSSASALGIYDQIFNVIENNVTNANTPGYVDQNLSIEASSGEEGGVVAGPLVSSRSTYLDQAVRNQTEQLGAAQQQSASDLTQINALFDTTGTAGVPGALTSFLTAA